jgi:endonuclease YncB( thermonuclease family)
MRVLFLTLTVLIAAAWDPPGMQTGRALAEVGDRQLTCTDLAPGPSRTVTRVIDSETVGLDDGTELRLIGTLGPRAIDAGAEPGAWPAAIAATEELRALLLGRTVELAFGGERSDRYGRQQAHAFVQEGNVARWVQGHLLAQGLARAYTAAGNRSCGEELLAAERHAREARRGLWAEAAYRPKSADRVAELVRARSTFQVVEGRIAGVAQVRGMIYLNFHADWRHAFSVGLRRTDRALLGTGASNPRTLEGRLVRVRGWIEQRNGPGTAPIIELSTAGLIEVLNERAPEAKATLGPPESEQPDQSKPPDLIETGR